jgi:hypothetical protein
VNASVLKSSIESDAVTVSGVEGLGDLTAELEGELRRERPLQEPVRQRFPVEELHYQEVRSILASHVVQGQICLRKTRQEFKRRAEHA